MSSEFREEDDPPEVKYIDSREFQNLIDERDYGEVEFRWIESFETEEQKWHRLVSEFVATLAGKNGHVFRIIELYARVFNYQGAEIVQTKGGLKHISNSAPLSVGNSSSLPLLLKNVSNVTKQVNLAQYTITALASIGQNAACKDVVQRRLTRDRLCSLYLFHMNYKQGLENLLSNFRLLRHFRYGSKRRADCLTDHIRDLFSERDIYTQAPESSSLALQMVLEDWNCPFQDEKIVQLSHGNTLQMRSLQVKGDAFYFLNETLNCALALNYPQAQEEMENFDTIIHVNSTNARGKQIFQFWRMISQYERRNKKGANAQGFLVTAQRLEEECKSETVGVGCAVMVETACKIRKQCNQHEEIIKTITETINRYPSLGPRMLQLADQCDVGYEKEVLLHQIYDLDSPEKPTLHPSEPTWLDYVENVVHVVGRYGSVRKTLEKSLKIIFEFLDFDSNRFNERAWILMEKVLELSDPPFVLVEWKSRKDWWSRYQKRKDGRRMSKAATQTKRAVMKALEELVI